jgi:energy-coupling factor transporter transmembrane protein EcfT
MVLSLALRFVPTLADECSAIMDAQAARGSSLANGGPTQRLRAFVAVLMPMFAGALRHASGLSRALDARCYEGGSGRTHYHVLRLGRRDAWFSVATLAYVAVLLALGMVGAGV